MKNNLMFHSRKRMLLIILLLLSGTLAVAWHEPAAAFVLTAHTAQHTAAATAAPELEQRDPQADLHATVAEWIRIIAEQHKLVPWQSASFTIEPLGPGTHGWLVHVLDDQTPVGYLIVTALKEGGYRLAEYGIGERPIFHMETLRESLVRTGLIEPETTSGQLAQLLVLPAHTGRNAAKPDEQPLAIERHYLYPFAAYWKVTRKDPKQTAYFDAFTGEQYPLTKDPNGKSPDVPRIDYQATNLSVLKDRMRLDAFDPYEDLGWIVEEPLHVKAASDVLDPLRAKQRLTLTVELYEDTVLLPYPIIGFAQWEQSEVYLLIYSEGLRYVPLIDAVRYGRLYLNTDSAEEM